VSPQEARARAPKIARAAMAGGTSIPKNLRGRLARIDIALGTSRRHLQGGSETTHRP